MPTEAIERTSSKRYEDSTPESEKLKEDFSKVGYGSAILALERSRMEKSWVKAGQDIRRGFKAVEDAVRQKIQSFDLRDVTRLTKKQIAEVMRIASTEMGDATIQAMSNLRDSLNVSLRRGARAANSVLHQKGLKLLSRDELAKIMEDSVIETAKPWPPNNPSTYDRRMVNASRIHLQQLRTSLSKIHPKGKVAARVLKDAHRGLRKLGPTSIRGGSLANKHQMILASEETRITNEVTLRIFQYRGVEYAYWRLSSAHPWYGGGEVCEWLASIPYGGSQSELRAAGLGGVSQSGLYAMNNWPSYPHPFCKCYPEPVIS